MGFPGYEHTRAAVSPFYRAIAGNCLVANQRTPFSVNQHELAPLSSEPDTRPASAVRGRENKHFTKHVRIHANVTA
jgi:hypothetical protein